MSNRFQDALDIQAGACNISGIARALVAAADECRNSTPFVQPSEDPAVRLIVHQLAFLTGFSEIEGLYGQDPCYGRLRQECKDATRLDTHTDTD